MTEYTHIVYYLYIYIYVLCLRPQAVTPPTWYALATVGRGEGSIGSMTLPSCHYPSSIHHPSIIHPSSTTPHPPSSIDRPPQSLVGSKVCSIPKAKAAAVGSGSIRATPNPASSAASWSIANEILLSLCPLKKRNLEKKLSIQDSFVALRWASVNCAGTVITAFFTLKESSIHK